MKNKGQSVLEIAVLTAIIVAALLAIQVYLKRGFQGRYKDLADSIGTQYEPGNTTSTQVNTTELTSTSHSGMVGQRSETTWGWFNIPVYVLKSSVSEQTYTVTNTTKGDYHVGSK